MKGSISLQKDGEEVLGESCEALLLCSGYRPGKRQEEREVAGEAALFTCCGVVYKCPLSDF